MLLLLSLSPFHCCYRCSSKLRPCPRRWGGGMLSKIGSGLATLFGTTLGLLISIIWFLSLPLNVIVWMRWTGWEWWGALLASISSLAIPVIGQLAYLCFTFMGLYFF